MRDNQLKIEEEDILVKIYLNEREQHQGTVLYEHIVMTCRQMGIAGATVTRGILGYGADRRLHSNKLLDLADNLPVIVEIIDTEENIARLRPFFDEIIHKGFITMEKVHVIKYRAAQS